MVKTSLALHASQAPTIASCHKVNNLCHTGLCKLLSINDIVFERRIVQKAHSVGCNCQGSQQTVKWSCGGV
eukprot:2377728-Amphidinium_carterae.1